MKTAREPTPVHPKPYVSLKSAPEILYVRRSRLTLVRTRIAVVVDQPSLQTSRFSPLILARPFKALSFLEKRSRDIVRLPLPLGSRRSKRGISRRSAFSQDLSVFAFDFCTQHYLVRQQQLCYLPSSPMVVLAYPTVCAAMRLRVLRYPIRPSATVSPAYRVSVRESRRGETVWTQSSCHHLSAKRLGRVDSQLVLPLESKSGTKSTG